MTNEMIREAQILQETITGLVQAYEQKFNVPLDSIEHQQRLSNWNQVPTKRIKLVFDITSPIRVADD